LFTSGRYDNLPGLPFPAAPGTYTGNDDVACYLRAYATKFKLPVRLNTNVTSLTEGDGGYIAKAGGVALETRQVVVATGPFQVPFIPPIADALGPDVYQVHSAHYRHPQSVRRERSWSSAPQAAASGSTRAVVREVPLRPSLPAPLVGADGGEVVGRRTRCRWLFLR
jgi:hypothetical protein